MSEQSDNKLAPFAVDGIEYKEYPLPARGELFPDGVEAWVWDDNVVSKRKVIVCALLPRCVSTPFGVISRNGTAWSHMALVSEGRPAIRHPTKADVKRGCLVKELESADFLVAKELNEEGDIVIVRDVTSIRKEDVEFMCYIDEIEALKNKATKKDLSKHLAI